MARKTVSLATLLAVGIVVSAGYAFTAVAIVVASERPVRDLLGATLFFGALALLPLLLLRPPSPIEVPLPQPRKKRRWWQFWRRKRKPKRSAQRIWKRRKGQEGNRPWGTPERSSVFVPAGRRTPPRG